MPSAMSENQEAVVSILFFQQMLFEYNSIKFKSEVVHIVLFYLKN